MSVYQQRGRTFLFSCFNQYVLLSDGSNDYVYCHSGPCNDKATENYQGIIVQKNKLMKRVKHFVA